MTAVAAAGPGGLRLHDLTVGHRAGTRLRRRDTVVLRGLNATARPGELTVLLGPNGVGKSTILRTVCGLTPALGGHVTIAGHDTTRTPPGRLARMLAAVLTDRVDTGLLTARDVVALGRHPHTGAMGRLTARDNAVVDQALADTGATALARRRISELSDGERQRVLTARALAQEPDTIVLDEPTAFLDVPSKAALNLLLRDLARRRGRTVLASTHDLELALRVADHVWLVDRAGALHTGAPEDLVLSGVLGATFDDDFAHDALTFDAALGVFSLVNRTPRAAVSLEAPGDRHAVLTRALAREGAEVTNGPAPYGVCALPDGGYRLTAPGAPPTDHPSVAALLHALRALVSSAVSSEREFTP